MNEELLGSFTAKRRVMSFAEYLELAEQTPRLQMRSAPQFAKDCFDHWGTEDVKYPWGSIRRFRLFDCPWSGGRDPLLGQEDVQNRVYRALSNFVNEGVANKLVLLHGPNGSAKSTLVRCIGRGLQAYSELDTGAIYRFNWIFPKQKLSRSDIGFSALEGEGGDTGASYAHLPDDLIDAKIVDEFRDHPLLLLPVEMRRELFGEWLGDNEGEGRFVISDYMNSGQLSHRNRGIFEALLANYQGDFLKVLRHVQVERFFISHRYREGYVTVEPQLSVDATEQQITQDSSIAALPAALQSLRLFRYGGELVTGNRGLVEYSDLLKRPLEAFKYLLTTVERSSVSLHNANLYLDLCFIGTSNEVHLAAFKEIAEFQSFKGRLDLVRVPYLLDLRQEEQIYTAKLKEAARSKHVAPHCAYVAALWAVMTRMVIPESSAYNSELEKVVDGLGPAEKAELYGGGIVPDGVSSTLARDLRVALSNMRQEGQSGPVYEGLNGASPRTLQTVLFNAANASNATYVSAFRILDEIEELCTHVSVYSFLRQKPGERGFQDPKAMIPMVRKRLINRVSDDFRQAMGLVDDLEYSRVFERYIQHVTHFIRGEKIRSEGTGEMVPADEKMMQGIEKTFGSTGSKEEFRSSLIAKIGAWSLDHANQSPDYEDIFDDYFSMLRDSYFKDHEKVVAQGIKHLLMYIADSGAALQEEDRKMAASILANLLKDHGYNKDSAHDAVRVLATERYV